MRSDRLRVRSGRVPRGQKMLKGHLPRVVYHQVYSYTKTNVVTLRSKIWTNEILELHRMGWFRESWDLGCFRPRKSVGQSGPQEK